MKVLVKDWSGLLILIFLLIPVYGFGQKEGFTLGDVDTGYVYLSPGMSEATVMDKLTPYVVNRVADSHSYVIAVRTEDSMGDLDKPLGSITFTNRKLSYMSRRWYESFNNKPSFELADKLFYLLKQEMGGKGEARATVKADSIRDPDKELKWVHVTIGNKRISLLITESEKPDLGRYNRRSFN